MCFAVSFGIAVECIITKMRMNHDLVWACTETLKALVSTRMKEENIPTVSHKNLCKVSVFPVSLKSG